LICLLSSLPNGQRFLVYLWGKCEVQSASLTVCAWRIPQQFCPERVFKWRLISVKKKVSRSTGDSNMKQIFYSIFSSPFFLENLYENFLTITKYYLIFTCPLIIAMASGTAPFRFWLWTSFLPLMLSKNALQPSTLPFQAAKCRREFPSSSRQLI
jgi:hypothetical protein